jgi:flagellin-like hook-associated protein FlgL
MLLVEKRNQVTPLEGNKVTAPTDNPFAEPTDEQVFADDTEAAEPTNAEAEDLDVDTPSEDAPEDTATGETVGETKTAAKKASASTKPPVPEGYTTPVQFAKMLTDYLHEKKDSNDQPLLDPEKTVAPQVVYSYIKNSQGGKNPFPTYEVGGRQWLLKLDDEKQPAEGYKWWMDKIERVAASKQNATTKAAKKAAKAAETPDSIKKNDETGPVEEAE